MCALPNDPLNARTVKFREMTPSEYGKIDDSVKKCEMIRSILPNKDVSIFNIKTSRFRSFLRKDRLNKFTKLACGFQAMASN